jgi:hypothetical protein
MHFKAGEEFRIDAGVVFTVTREIDAGPDRRVYAVTRNSDGVPFVFKHARSREIPKGKKGMDKEKRTVAKLAEMGERHPAIAYSGSDWLIREWVKGELGLVWFQRWKASGYNSNDPQWRKFYAMMERTASRGLVIGALDLDDIIEEPDGEWNIIDSGRVREMSVSEAWEFYRDDLIYSWGDKLGNRDVCAVLVALVRPGLGEAR